MPAVSAIFVNAPLRHEVAVQRRENADCVILGGKFADYPAGYGKVPSVVIE